MVDTGALDVCGNLAVRSVNGDLEGDVLLTLDGTSGITVSDLLSVLAAVITFIQAIRIRAAVRRNPSVEHGDITEKP